MSSRHTERLIVEAGLVSHPVSVHATDPGLVSMEDRVLSSDHSFRKPAGNPSFVCRRLYVNPTLALRFTIRKAGGIAPYSCVKVRAKASVSLRSISGLSIGLKSRLGSITLFRHERERNPDATAAE